MKGPARPLRLLLVEDSEDDALLLLRELRRGGYEPVCERVSTPEEMERVLEEASKKGRPWQIVISDYHMPRFGASDALALLRRLGCDTPFVVVSGKIGEEAAVAMLRAGAQDYVNKENVARLCPAIERELPEAEDRGERERAEKALHFLSEASAEFSTSHDYRVMLAGVARLAVPRLADWCAVDILGEALQAIEKLTSRERDPPDPRRGAGEQGDRREVEHHRGDGAHPHGEHSPQARRALAAAGPGLRGAPRPRRDTPEAGV